MLPSHFPTLSQTVFLDLSFRNRSVVILSSCEWFRLIKVVSNLQLVSYISVLLQLPKKADVVGFFYVVFLKP